MGLAERRAAKDFEDKQFPTLQNEIREAAGFDVLIEVNWGQLAIDDYGHMYEEAWRKVYFTPVIEALRQITRDDLGKAALKDRLKHIEFRNTTGASSPGRAISFEGGTLMIDHAPVSNIDDIKDRTTYLVELLEKAL